jgi:deazaflavin-dependent oxidoreductase (nitroreductase family)
VSDWNDGIIREFRDNDGAVGGPFEGSRLLLLTTIGSKTGERRVSPLAFSDDGTTRIVLASKAGSPSHPSWYYNVLRNPSVHVEAGTDTGIDEYDAIASVMPEEQRVLRYPEMVASHPAFASYWTNTTESGSTRVNPMVILTRTG